MRLFSITIGLVIALTAQGQEKPVHRFEGEFAERDGVQVSVDVEAQVYTWTVQNIDAPPITSFEMWQKNCYNQRMPVGWQSEYEDDFFRAWTDDPDAAIKPGNSGEFTTRVSSTGAVLGEVSLTLGHAGDGKSITIQSIWGPVRKPRSMVYLVAFTVAGVALAHTALLMWISKRKRKAAT